MKLLSFLLFFNKNFMTSYTTTIGSTIYFPSKDTVLGRPTSSMITLMHELVHIYDAQKLNTLVFSLLYLTPQILSLLLMPLFFVLPWWLVLLMIMVLVAPIPSFFRMKFEKRAYFVSLYVMHKLSSKFSFKLSLEAEKDSMLRQFKGADYYFMWPFSSLEKEFDAGLLKIKNNQRPIEDPVFDIIDELLEKV